MIYDKMTGRFARASTLAVALFALGFGLVGCKGDLLNVQDPENLNPGSLEDPAQLPARFNGVIAEFQEAYDGTGNNNIDRLLSTSGLFADELISTGSFTTRTVTDRRDQFAPRQGNTSDASYLGLHQARRQGREVADFIAQEVSQSDPRIAVARSIQGYSIIALAENFCAPLPLSSTEGGDVGEYGQPLETSALLDRAVDAFDQALAANGGSNLAKVGKGRALLDQGNYSAAAQAVADVPTSFVYTIDHSSNSTREQMPLFDLQDVGRFSMANREGSDGIAGIESTEGNGLDFVAARDPRIPWGAEPGGGFLPQFTVYWQLRYPTRDSDIVLADGIEARLIEAEAALNAGDVEGWLSILNDLRENVGSLMAARFDDPAANDRVGVDNPTAGNDLEPLEDPGTESERVDLMFRERAFWLYLSNHRLGDLRRLIRQYGRTQDQVFPTGDYHKAGGYGTDVTLPVDFDESNNPNFDVESCSVSDA